MLWICKQKNNVMQMKLFEVADEISVSIDNNWCILVAFGVKNDSILWS